MASPIHLEGTTLEGGGQLVRLALSISALTGTPIRITNIRGNRSGGGGLKQQHLTALGWLSKACNARVEGAVKKSRTLVFEADVESPIPSTAPAQTPTIVDIGSPGAITLVFQALLPFLLFYSAPTSDPHPSPIHVTIKGGTNVPLAPSVDYLTSVLLPTLTKIGLPPIHINLLKRGWSAGAHEIGAVTITVEPLAPGSCLPAFNLTDRGEVMSVKATVLAPRAAEKDFQREIRAQLEKVLPDVPVEIKFELSGHQKRLYILLVATTSTGCKLGRDWLYDRRFTSLSPVVSEMAKRVVEELDAEIKSGACVDEYCTDQLVVFQALAKGRSVVEGGKESGEPRKRSLHARTAGWVVREMLGVEVQDDGSCEGVGFVVGERWRRGDGKKTGVDVEELVEGLEKLEVT